jgi:hypothetical protein
MNPIISKDLIQRELKRDPDRAQALLAPLPGCFSSANLRQKQNLAPSGPANSRCESFTGPGNTRPGLALKPSTYNSKWTKLRHTLFNCGDPYCT